MAGHRPRLTVPADSVRAGRLAAHTARSVWADTRGVTLVELLIILVVIAVLMAVVIPVYLGHRQRALATRAQQTTVLTMEAIESCMANNPHQHWNEAGQGGVNCASPEQIELEAPELSGRVKDWLDSTQPNADISIANISLTDDGKFQNNGLSASVNTVNNQHAVLVVSTRILRNSHSLDTPRFALGMSRTANPPWLKFIPVLQDILGPQVTPYRVYKVCYNDLRKAWSAQSRDTQRVCPRGVWGDKAKD